MKYQIQVFFSLLFLAFAFFFPFPDMSDFFLERKKSNTNKTSTFFVHNPVNFFKYLSLFLGLRKKEKEGRNRGERKEFQRRVLDEEKALHFPFLHPCE